MIANQPNPAQQLDRDALTQLVQNHARLMYRVAHSVLRHAQDAEDAVQDALLKLHRTDACRHIGTHVEDARAYLVRTVWRTAFDRLETRKRPAAATHDDAFAERNLRDHRAGPERAAIDADERALLHELIDALDEDLRQPLLLSAIEELNSREIARVMQLPEGTVRTRLMRARAALRRNFEAQQNTRTGETAAARG